MRNWKTHADGTPETPVERAGFWVLTVVCVVAYVLLLAGVI